MRFTIPKLMFLFLILSFVLVEGKQHPKPCKELPSLFFHDIVFNGTNAENATSAIVAAPAGSNLTTFAPQFRFGNIIVFDNLLTLDSNLSSPQVGRAQGMYLYNSKLFPNAWVAFSLVLNSTDYQGTINLVGANPLWGNPPRDISIVGATGDFFMHRGVATLLTDGIEGIVYIRLKIDVKFYECEFGSFFDS